VPAGTWTPERVIAALQDRAREFGEPPKAYEWSVATVRGYLRASPCPDCGGPVVSAKARHCQGCAAKRAHRPAWSAEEILAALRDWAAEHGAPRHSAAGGWLSQGRRRSAGVGTGACRPRPGREKTD
jgi:hypothetical protein